MKTSFKCFLIASSTFGIVYGREDVQVLTDFLRNFFLPFSTLLFVSDIKLRVKTATKLFFENSSLDSMIKLIEWISCQFSIATASGEDTYMSCWNPFSAKHKCQDIAADKTWHATREKWNLADSRVEVDCLGVFLFSGIFRFHQHLLQHLKSDQRTLSPI